MCEVTSTNFERIYSQIIDDLRAASFISIDCEFSGLFDDNYKCSLFDSPKARFNKLQNSLTNVIIVQLGLSTFKYEKESNRAVTSTYTFYLKPTRFIGNSKFTCQVGSIEFLCKQGFNFNKLFYDGINYLNESSEAELLRMIEDGSLVDAENIDKMQTYFSSIAEWSGGVSPGDEMMLRIGMSGTFVYMLHLEIRKRFHNIWTQVATPDFMIVRKVNESEKRKLLSNKEEDMYLKKELFYSILGFSRIVKELENLKKPIIGHNFLIDLILIYKQFYNPMPLSYKKFKKVISNIFPNIYDTKIISFELKRILSRDDAWYSNTLSDLYHYLKNGKGATLVMCAPLINHRNEEYLTKENFHEAGFDSYCTGFCFLKMAHIFSWWNTEKISFYPAKLPTSVGWLLNAVEPMKNKLNISRGQVNYIVLNDEDPKSVRPGLLFIQSKTKKPLDIPKVTNSLAKYASVDVQLFNKYSGLMAVATRKQVEEILGHFQDHKEIKVIKYNFLKHSNSGRVIASSTVLASLIVIIMCASRGWQRVQHFLQPLLMKWVF